MLRSLRDIQSAFAAHLAGDDRPELVSAIDGNPRTAIGRLRLHRRQTALSLTSALAATFPTVAAIVGQEFFGQLARCFVAATPLANPVLSQYGEGFDQFLSKQEAVHGLPYLPDVARLDWALNLAFHAPMEPRLSAADLASHLEDLSSNLTVRLPAGSSLIESDYPLDLIWQVSQPGTTIDTVDLAAGPSCLVVFRRPADAAFAVLTSGEAAFISRLSCGELLATAARQVSQGAEDLDLAATFARLLAIGLLVAGTTLASQSA